MNDKKPMRYTVLLTLIYVMSVQESVASIEWEQLPLKDSNTTFSPDNLNLLSTQVELELTAIQQAADALQRNLAADVDALLEKLPEIVQTQLVQTGLKGPARVMQVKAGQQLVYAADSKAPPSPRPLLPAVLAITPPRS